MRIIITGATGFIGANLVHFLNEHGHEDLILVDKRFSVDKTLAWENIAGAKFSDYLSMEDYLQIIEDVPAQAIIHLYAVTNTQHKRWEDFYETNIKATKIIMQACYENSTPFLYASSAATYGATPHIELDPNITRNVNWLEHNFSDDHKTLKSLVPGNMYAMSKHVVDQWAVNRFDHKYATGWKWAGMKFFNVYGAREWHKKYYLNDMRSPVYRFWDEWRKQSFRELPIYYPPGRGELRHGYQRDFICIDDVLSVILFLLHRVCGDNPEVVSSQDYCLEKLPVFKSGIYNIGTGKARSFLEMAYTVGRSLSIKNGQVDGLVKLTGLPQDMRKGYQGYTCANLDKLKSIGYLCKFTRWGSAIKQSIPKMEATHHEKQC